MRGSREDSTDLEALDLRPRSEATSTPSRRTVRAWRSHIGLAVTLALAAGLGSAATLALVDRGGTTRTAQPAATTIELSSTVASVPVNVVSRVGQHARLDPWTIVVTAYRDASTVGGEQAPPGRKWLVAEMSVTNDGTTPHVFSLEDVEARYSVANGWESVSAHLVGPVRDRVGPGDTHARDVLFSLPETASVYTVVVSRGLEAQKNTDSAVEFDLNCC